MDPSITRTNNRTVNFRFIIVSAISFFLGLQFHHLKALFQINLLDSDATEYLAWAPDEFIEKPQRESDQDNHHTNKRKGKRNKKPLPRYHDSNYTKDSFEPLPWSLPEPSSTRYQTSEEFMVDYIALKRAHNIPLPWEQDKYEEDQVTLPRPIIGLNFPKSATLTMSEYFKCAGIVSQHTATQDGRIGICMMENHLADKPPMEGCNTERSKIGDTKPIEVIFDIGLQGPPCYYASVHDGGLENIAKHYPEGTIMLVTRNAKKWARSITGWNGRIMNLWADESCHFDGSLEGEGMKYWADQFASASGDSPRQKMQYWIEFYEAHTQKIREFALKHLSLTYVEVELENVKMAEQLEQYTGVKQSCVQVCHPGPFWIRKHDTTSKCHPPGEEPPEIDLDAKNDDDS
mmetsp:Transcript_17804/g.27949  ORF Transcript_17804/g.27949 Transcript_17804/m.27949 type:complete len:403 (-) Transcript_17804:1191-2399(-)|eukprot:CAMPEP_0201716590 /NCGR_PEP_ID=MMETSP0593-20130828/2529_1 /ASSEMBLY_ACC=CAM_ASM_000672 /TAXON_ID=267983 /ORGANISM="Skeletonema japonicum, Strain CCMP2506" /LENGTH=402 /DNA_ID=CAMNT_0048206423 /DNA_START=90 /DNA_END=1298 /DNA_ORIENTATION=-